LEVGAFANLLLDPPVSLRIPGRNRQYGSNQIRAAAILSCVAAISTVVLQFFRLARDLKGIKYLSPLKISGGY
jgi:hypothetical protein